MTAHAHAVRHRLVSPARRRYLNPLAVTAAHKPASSSGQVSNARIIAAEQRVKEVSGQWARAAAGLGRALDASTMSETPARQTPHPSAPSMTPGAGRSAEA